MYGHARPHSAVSCAKMAKQIEMVFGLTWTKRRTHVFHGGTLAQPSEYDYTTEPSVFSGDAALCQITLTTCYHNTDTVRTHDPS